MRRSTDRILTTHAGSLPRPEGLVRMMWDRIDEKPVFGIDIVGDGEMSKIGGIDPGVAWAKPAALVEGAGLASDELW